MRWMKVRLGEVAKVISGFAFKSSDFRMDTGIPVIKIANIRRERVEFNDTYYLPPDFLKVDPKFHVTFCDVLISLTGSHITLPNSVVGRVAKYRHDFIALLNQRAGKIITDEKLIDKEFLYQYLTLEDVRREIALYGQGGANQCNISPSNVESINVPLPPLPVQQKIASILSSYDDLIENNLKRIKLLEEAAQNIYKEWFVNFRINGELLEVNKETGLPHHWQKTELGKVISKLESGGRPKGGIDKELKEGIPSIGAENVIGLGRYDFLKEKYVPVPFFENLSKGIIEDRDILIYKDGAYIGKTTLFQDAFPHPVCAVNEHVFLIRARSSIHQYFLFFTLNSKDYFNKMQALNSNAAQPGINQSKLRSLEISFPEVPAAKQFNDAVEPLVKQIFNLAKQNKNLREARDLLLPRLMNGSIDV